MSKPTWLVTKGPAWRCTISNNELDQASDQELGILRAAWHSFWGREIGYHPPGFTTKEIIQDISSTINELAPIDASRSSTIYSLLRQSLDEVKYLTEYSDNKSSRNLAIIALLSALTGFIFSQLVSTYPIHFFIDNFSRNNIHSLIVISTYIFFCIYVLFVGFGALITFHATRIRFKYPREGSYNTKKDRVNISSYLFFDPIVRLTPKQWAEGFLEKKDKRKTERSMNKIIELEYIKNYITESYLIACKVADKIMYLEPAQRALLVSIRILICWFLLLIITFSFVPVPARSEPVHPTGMISNEPSVLYGNYTESSLNVAAQKFVLGKTLRLRALQALR